MHTENLVLMAIKNLIHRLMAIHLHKSIPVLGKVHIIKLIRAEYDSVSILHCVLLGRRNPRPPPLNDSILGKLRLGSYLVPSYDCLSVLIAEVLQFFHKPVLKVMFIRKAIFRLTCLALRTCCPMRLLDLISPYMHIAIREEPEDFLIYIFGKPDCSIVAWTQGNREILSPYGPAAAAKLRIGLYNIERMARHIYLRNHVHAQ